MAMQQLLDVACPLGNFVFFTMILGPILELFDRALAMFIGYTDVCSLDVCFAR